MKWQPKYKAMSDVKPIDRKHYLCVVDGNVVEGVELEHSREVALGRRNKGSEVFFDSSDPSQNWKSARVSKDKKRSLEKGIQLYRMWFNFLKLGLELEDLGVSLVRKQHTTIKDHNISGIPKSVIEKSRFKQGGSKGDSGIKAIYRSKQIQKVKVKRRAYEGWDLDQVKTQQFDKWWKTHSHLFEGYYPSIISSKNEWIEDPNFVYVRIDKNSHLSDIRDFMQNQLTEAVKGKAKPKYKIEGKNPRVKVLQNNLNAIILLIKGKTPKEIYNDNKIFLRSTDEHMDAKRSHGEDNRLSLPRDRKSGKPLYSALVSKQRDMGLHHLFEVCDGRFGEVLNQKKRKTREHLEGAR